MHLLLGKTLSLESESPTVLAARAMAPGVWPLAAIFNAWSWVKACSRDLKPAYQAFKNLARRVVAPQQVEDAPWRDRSSVGREHLHQVGRLGRVRFQVDYQHRMARSSTMARFDKGFLASKAQDVGLALALVPVVTYVVYPVVAAPAGSLSDRIDRRWPLIICLAVLVAADVVLAFVHSVPGVLIGVALWDLHMGLTQGLLAAVVVDTAPSHMHGTAFGLFNPASGVTLLAASVVAGLLCSRMGPEATFLAGAVFALLATAGLVLMASRGPNGGTAAV